MFGKKPDAQTQTPEPEAKPGDFGVVIHAMPTEFYGKPVTAAAEAPKPAAPVPAVVVPPQAPKPVNPTQPAIPSLSKRDKGRSSILLIVVGVLVLAALAAMAYVFLQQPVPVETPVVSETPTITTPTETVVTPEPEPEVTEPQPAKDTDSDGLTDVEELLYGTDFRDPDTDHDTFLDGNEVFHRYDPKGTAPSTLLDTGAVKVYSDAATPFTMYYPVSWKATTNATASEVTFKTPTQAKMTVVWAAKAVELTPEEWVVANVDGASAASLDATYTKEGYYIAQGEDGFTAYLDGGASIFVLTYDLNGASEIAYLQTYAMMVNSFQLVSAAP